MLITDETLFPEIGIWPEARAYLRDNQVKARRELYSPDMQTVVRWVSADLLKELWEDPEAHVTKFGYFRGGS